MGRSFGENRGGRRHGRRARYVLHRALPRSARAHALLRCRRPLSRSRRQDASRRAAQLFHLLALGHLPRRAPPLHPALPGTRRRNGAFPARLCRTERAAARVDAVGQRDRHDDRLPRRSGHCRCFSQKYHVACRRHQPRPAPLPRHGTQGRISRHRLPAHAGLCALRRERSLQQRQLVALAHP